MKLDKDSINLIIIAWIVAVGIISVLLCLIRNRYISIPLAAVVLVLVSFVTWFHRIPQRERTGDERAVTSVADGKVVIIEKVFEKEFLQRECIQVSVYMNFFDVHANFWPVSGEITYYKYHPGNYFLAFQPKASEKNEHSSTAIRNSYGSLLFKQIAGTFARRIVCYSKEGEQVERGRQCGIIKFGSRIDMYLPLDAEIKVKLGDKVRACESIIAEL